MTQHPSINKFRLIFIMTVLLLLGAGLQSAFATLLPEQQSHSSAVRVDRCHSINSPEQSSSCCQIETCHQTQRPQRDLGGPEYQTRHKGSHSLAHESKPLTPQLKVGQPFISPHIILPHFASLPTGSRKPLQSLDSLRTIVLLH